jgi:hypothetical protein
LNTAAIEQLDKLGLTPDTHKVALACALLWTYRTPTEIHRLLGLSGLSNQRRQSLHPRRRQASGAVDLELREATAARRPGPPRRLATARRLACAALPAVARTQPGQAAAYN